ncbi:Bgt-5199-2 [Blumeria graminis f. sp. tritici]|uniref:Bgt-5199-2 n=3 Tax=Blumeria graminis TaxID=34373 RepID=A0A061HGY3_BLUGR|nr:hypothetical protein BGT96224_5199B [Blumeria graminis f. sp. tritici 96224]VCU38893.1 Bgt-5199-2 [Blumeria graminis f. sp. tritici]
MYQIMVETGTWSFGEVRRNGRGVPVVHDILEKLGVMRCSKDLPNGFPESPDENRALRGQLEATRDQKKHREEHEFRKRSHLEQAPPSLVHTDRESSVDSSRSSFSGTTKNSIELEHKYTPPALIVNSLSNFEQQNEPLPPNKCTSFKYSVNPADSKNLSAMTLPSSTNVTLASDICGNTPMTDRLKNMPSYHQWNRIGLNSSTEPAPTQFMTQVTAPFSDIHVYNAMNHQNTSFNALPMLGSEFLQPININMEMVPTVMKYSFDPYMG